MRLSKSESRIVGVQLGEAHINVIKPGIPPLTADFALVREDEALCGMVQRRLEWSERVHLALRELIDAMEEDELSHVFKDQPLANAAAEPEQL